MGSTPIPATIKIFPRIYNKMYIMWEYKIRLIRCKTKDELVNELNKEGECNWELIHYQEEKSPMGERDRDINVRLLFKRNKNHYEK